MIGGMEIEVELAAVHIPDYPKQIRKSVTLTARDLHDLDLIRRSPEALAAVGAPVGLTEAALLHILIAHGIEQAREAAEAAGYVALAASYRAEPQEQAARQAMRARRRVREDLEA
jgi:hypothetical protein